MKVVLSSCVAGFAVASSSPPTDVLAKFEEFRSKWGVTYTGAEYAERAKYFEDHLRRVEHLQEVEQGTATYTYLGPFADRSPAEMAKRFGASQSRIWAHLPEAPLLNISLGASLDWVAKGAVNPIQNQGQCGSCWAFSTACNLEGAGFVTTGKLVKVSEQNIVDCDHSDDGCNGGIPSSALTWSSRNGGVASEQAYPYHARDGSCKSNVAKIVQNKGYHSISTNEDQIAQALQTYGPLSIAVDANGFNGYQGGVLQNPSCSSSRWSLNHAINIVGYGEDRVPYWKIRNSWGTSFGEAGYIRLYRGSCTCGVCQQVVTATGVTVSGAPTPPTPPTPPAPTPPSPSPSPCHVCTWNSDCPSGQDCYYPSASANSGCCYSSPPSANRDDEMLPETQFEQFVKKYNKIYRDDEEKRVRFGIFNRNMAQIESKNAEEGGEYGEYVYGINYLSDLDDVEFKQNYLGLRIPPTMQNLSTYVPTSSLLVPSSIDWVSRGAVTPVKNQGQCGSCWTFSTTGAIEGAWAIATGRLVSLSEQQVVDCATSAGQGCGGGWPSRAIQWEESQQICGESEYRYTARQGQCHGCYSPVLQRGSVNGVYSVQASISGMKAALAEKPVSVCVDAQNWQHYNGGVFSNCGTNLDHAVLAVGYDQNTWKVKNSWGTWWGHAGYIHLRMGNTCGVLNVGVIASVSGSTKFPDVVV